MRACRPNGERYALRSEVEETHDSQFAPEYEDCRIIAAEQRVPLKQVMQEALRLYLDKKNG